MATDTALVVHPGHEITVTPGPFGRAYVDCSCGLTRVCASGYAANRVALIHHHEAGGCNCPEHVVAAAVHPTDPGSSPSRSDVETTASTHTTHESRTR